MAKLVVSLVIAIIILLFQISIQIMIRVAKTSITIVDSEEIFDNSRPENIPDDIWQLRYNLQNPQPDLTSVVTDLIASGVDPRGLLNLVSFMGNNILPDRVESHQTTTKLLYQVGDKVVTLPFSRDLIEHTFTELPWYIVFLIPFASFGASYLPLLCTDKFPVSFLWLTAFVATTSIFSLIQPPDLDPYITSPQDTWICLTRAFFAIVLNGLLLLVDRDIDQLEFGIYDWSVRYLYIRQFLFNACFYGYHLMFVFIFMNFIGQPFTTVIWFIEAFNRYIFGHSGTCSYYTIYQFIFGCFGVFMSRYGLELDYGLGAMLAAFFCFFHLDWARNWFQLLHFFACVLGQILANFTIKYEIMRIVALCWFILVETFLPYLSSSQIYFLYNTRFLKFSHIRPYLRVVTIWIVTPLFFCSFPKCNKWILAFLFNHILNRASCEPHLVGFALSLTFGLEYELGLKNHIYNLLLALLIVTKLNVLFPVIRITFRLRTSFTGDLMMYFPTLLFYMMPFIDDVVSMPSFFFSAITGAPMATYSGSMVTIPSPPRPFYFWDQFPSSENNFYKRIGDHPIETPSYTSAEKAIKQILAPMVESGRLGIVSPGSFYLMLSDTLGILIHIITIEPHAIRFQIRGLEYESQTLCHHHEISFLQSRLESDFDGITEAMYGIQTVADLRARDCPILMYDVAKSDLSIAFLGVANMDLLIIFTWTFFEFIFQNLDQIDFSVFPQPAGELSNDHLEQIEQQYDHELPPNQRAQICHFFGFYRQLLFNENDSLKYSEVIAAFQEQPNLPDEMNNLAISRVLSQIVKLSLGFSYYSIAIGLPDLQNVVEMDHSIQSFQRHFCVGLLSSREVQAVLNSNQLDIITLEVIRGVPKILKFTRTRTTWNVFQIQEEWVRGLWANEARDILFYQEDTPERNAVQSSSQTLNNLIIQLADIPIGYPAYVSSIITSYFTPLQTGDFEKVSRFPPEGDDESLDSLDE